MNPKVFVIVLNWNGLQNTVQCLDSVFASSYSNFEVVVVDNGSSDASAETIASKYPQAILIRNRDNLGFAEGNNIGIQHAMEHGAQYVWLINNDAVARPDALGNLVHEAEKYPRAGVVGSKIYFLSTPTKIWFAGGVIDWFKGEFRSLGCGETDAGQYDRVGEVQAVSGCSMLVKEEVCARVGLMDKDFFLYWEEVDWCVRARRAGLKCRMAPSSAVYHKVSDSTAKIGTLEKVEGYYHKRNVLYLIKKSFPFPIRQVIALAVMLRLVKWQKRHALRMLLSSIFPSLSLRPGESPILFGIRDYLSKKMGKLGYELG